MARLGRGVVGTALAVTAATPAAVGRVVGHSGGLRGAAPESLSVPVWLFLATGGGVIGASFLLASFVTDRAFVDRLNAWRGPRLSLGRVAEVAGRSFGVAALAVVLVSGLLAGSVTPLAPERNAATLVVWVGWWGG
ncbi:MAG: hypothetical protein J07HB67_00516, partial [halophilic archaeon J07HB67]